MGLVDHVRPAVPGAVRGRAQCTAGPEGTGVPRRARRSITPETPAAGRGSAKVPLPDGSASRRTRSVSPVMFGTAPSTAPTRTAGSCPHRRPRRVSGNARERPLPRVPEHAARTSRPRPSGAGQWHFTNRMGLAAWSLPNMSPIRPSATCCPWTRLPRRSWGSPKVSDSAR